MNEKTKKIISVTVNTLIWIFVAFAVVVTVLVFAAQGSEDGVPSVFGKSFITIETESMEDTYKKGDLVFMTKLDKDDKRDLEVGTIITYRAPIDINGDGKTGDINTHTIYSHEEGSLTYVTKGDNNPAPDNTGDDPYTVHADDIIGVCTEGGKIRGLGAVLAFLRSGLGFFLCIVLPLILFFLYEVYVFVSVLISEKAKKVAGDAAVNEEEIKRRAIEEYIKNLEKQNKESEASIPKVEGADEADSGNGSDDGENK